MGAGRKTFTYDADTRGAEQFNQAAFENSQRNLGEELGGCLFGCTNDTYDECVNDLVFGLPRSHWCYVQYIKKGMPIFLFNYQTRQLHGIFRAVGDGDWKIKPHGWVGGTNRDTQYPCQVKVEVYSKCPPLSQAEYGPIMKQCYYPDSSSQRGKMMFELRKAEAQNLCRAFDRAAGHVNANTRPHPVPGSVPSAAAAAAPASSSAVAAAAPKATAALPKAAAAPSAASRAAPGSGVASDGLEVVGGAKKPKPNAWSADGAQASDAPSSAVPSTTSKAAATREPAAPPTPPATPKASTSDPTSDPSAASATRSAFRTYPAQQQPTAPPSSPTPASGAGYDSTSQLSAVHAAVSAVDTAAADALWHCLSSMMNQMQSCIRQNNLMLQGMRSLKLENAFLKSELAAVRMDTSRVGAAVNVPVAAESPALANLNSSSFGMKIQDIYLLGGHDGAKWLDSMHQYTPAYECVTEVGLMPFARGYGGAAVIGRSIFMIGGGDGSSWLKTAVRYDIDSKEWFQLADMEAVRGSLAVAALDGLVYAMGGGQPGVNHDTTEVFNLAANAWSPGPRMTAARFTTAGAALGSAIYMTGGFDGTQYLNSAEMLDPRVGQWQLIAPMVNKRGSHVCTVVEQQLFAIGGWDAKDYLAGVEVYDARANAWRAASPMAAPRAYGAAATVDGAVFTLGGMQSQHGQVHNETVERYDAATDKWAIVETVPCPEAVKRAFLSACVVDAY